MKVSNKTRLFCRQEQLRYLAKRFALSSLGYAVDAGDFGETFHLSGMDWKTLPARRESTLISPNRHALISTKGVEDLMKADISS